MVEHSVRVGLPSTIQREVQQQLGILRPFTTLVLHPLLVLLLLQPMVQGMVQPTAQRLVTQQRMAQVMVRIKQRLLATTRLSTRTLGTAQRLLMSRFTQPRVIQRVVLPLDTPHTGTLVHLATP